MSQIKNTSTQIDGVEISHIGSIIALAAIGSGVEPTGHSEFDAKQTRLVLRPEVIIANELKEYAIDVATAPEDCVALLRAANVQVVVRRQTDDLSWQPFGPLEGRPDRRINALLAKGQPALLEANS